MIVPGDAAVYPSSLRSLSCFYIAEVGAWEYVQQQRHAFFDQMQVIISLGLLTL